MLVLQVPTPEPLRSVDPHEEVTRQLHADGEYTGIWVNLFEQLLTRGSPFRGADHPVLVDGRYVMNPSPIPRYDNPKLHQSQCLYLFGAGREKKIYAVPPHTDVVSLAFEDYPFQQEDLSGRKCRLCGAENVYFDEIFDAETGERYYQCSDTGYCLKRRSAQASQEKGKEPMNERTPVMEGRHITVRFGPGCPYCQEHTDLEKGRCPVCHTIWGVRDVSFQLYPRGDPGHRRGIRLRQEHPVKDTLFRPARHQRRGHPHHVPEWEGQHPGGQLPAAALPAQPPDGHGLSEPHAGSADEHFLWGKILRKSSSPRAAATPAG